MLRRLLLVALGMLIPGTAVMADGIPGADRAKRCAINTPKATTALWETKNWTMNISNEGKICAIVEAIGYQDNGNIVNLQPYESMAISTRPQHGDVLYSSDSRSYIQYRPAAGFVGEDTFGYRLLPGNALRVVTVTVGP